MEDDQQIVFKSREEFSDILKQKHEIEMFFSKISIWFLFLYLLIDGIFKFTLDVLPITFMLEKYWWIFFIIGVFLYVFWTRTDRYDRNRRVYAHYIIIKQYEKSKGALELGIETKSQPKVQEACEELEEMEEFFSEMDEYKEILQKGHSWLRENNSDSE